MRAKITGIIGNGQVSTELKVQFQKEVYSYLQQLEIFLRGNKEVLGSKIQPKMPEGNVNTIKEKFIILATNELNTKGATKPRAKSVAKATFNDLADQLISELK